MALCRGCEQRIEWVRLTSGKNHPVDPDYVDYDEACDGDKLVTDGGNIITVDCEMSRPNVKGRISHFATCPHGDAFRK